MQLMTHGNKDIVFSDYGPTLKAMRKIAHGALKAYGDGLVELEQSVLEEVEALFKRFDAKNGDGFDPRNDLGESNISKAFHYSLLCRDVYPCIFCIVMYHTDRCTEKENFALILRYLI